MILHLNIHDVPVTQRHANYFQHTNTNKVMTTCNEIIEKFDLSSIGSWQLDSGNAKVELPALQRGFVWRVTQIESLWDSLLRGFPIGSFLLSKSEEGVLSVLDGQQRATAIALGYYDPWQKGKDGANRFWSLKNIPIVWIDLDPKEKSQSHKFSVRVITQSHPWGYQRKNPNAKLNPILNLTDRRNALEIFREIPENKEGNYVQLFSRLNVFPYDADLPVPLPFLINAILENEQNWKDYLIQKYIDNLPVDYIKTRYSNCSKCYVTQLKETLNKFEIDNEIFTAIKNLNNIQIPGIVIKKEILMADDEQTNEGGQFDDPTLFVRLNSSGTTIEGEELIYSIYKASFPQAKQLVERIGAHFVAPSRVISLIARLANTEVNDNQYPPPMNVNDFRKKILDKEYKDKLKEFIGDEKKSSAKLIFSCAIDLLLSKDDIMIPPVLVKSIVKSSPDLFLMLLQWIKMNGTQVTANNRYRILATTSALSWWGNDKDNSKFVRQVWNNISKPNFWNREYISEPFYQNNDFIIHPFISPTLLRLYLIEDVVGNGVEWGELIPKNENRIIQEYALVVNYDRLGDDKENELRSATSAMWSNFINKLFANKSLLLFAQRTYINDSFDEFNQMEDLEDTNRPWDWDHIYPDSWVSGKWYINANTRHWTKSNGNFRALSLEENRSDNNRISPKERLLNDEGDFREQSFINENDWEYWKTINGRINDGDNEMIKNHLNAIINRLCNIYEEWYLSLNVEELFNFNSGFVGFDPTLKNHKSNS